MGRLAQRHLRSCAFAACFVALATIHVLAQTLARPATLADAVPNFGTLLAQTSAPDNPFFLSVDGNAYSGVRVADWLVFPQLVTGLSFNDNIALANSGRKADMIATLDPSFVAVRNAGIQNTLVYGALDDHQYFHYSQADMTNWGLGFQHFWEVQRDLVISFAGSAAQLATVQTTGASGTQTLNGVTIPTPGVAIFQNPNVLPIQQNDYTARLSIIKLFNQFFSATGFSIVNTQFQNAVSLGGGNDSQAYRDQTETTVTQRFGYKFSGSLYSFFDSVLDEQNIYGSPRSSSMGYRETVGLGSGRVGLFNGEIYAGYQERQYPYGSLHVFDAGVFGGRVTWNPTAEISSMLIVDRSINTANFISAANPTVSVATGEQVGLNVGYSLSPNWIAGVNLSYARNDYSVPGQWDNSYGFGCSASYVLSRTSVLSLNYSYTRYAPSEQSAGSNDNIVTFKIAYRL